MMRSIQHASTHPRSRVEKPGDAPGVREVESRAGVELLVFPLSHSRCLIPSQHSIATSSETDTPPGARVPNSGGNRILCINIAAWQIERHDEHRMTAGCKVDVHQPLEHRSPFSLVTLARWQGRFCHSPSQQLAGHGLERRLSHPKCGQRATPPPPKLSGQSGHHLETTATGTRTPIGRPRRDIGVPAPLSARRHGPSTATSLLNPRPSRVLGLSIKLVDGKAGPNQMSTIHLRPPTLPLLDNRQCDHDSPSESRHTASRSHLTHSGDRSRICRV